MVFRIHYYIAMNFPIFSPKTSFPMKGNLVQKEPFWLTWWEKIELYSCIRELRKGKPLFVLHDGPPYANGDIHVGHGLNKILKDFCNRQKSMTCHDVAFVPGWDCHGLPIESQMEKEYLKKKRPDFSVPQFRRDCHRFAAEWIQVQKKAFQRLGVVADWDHFYATMEPAFEARMLHHFFRLLEKGYVYRGVRPVLWSPSEQTALAEAEVEYHEVVSRSLYVRFPLSKIPSPQWENTCAVIWTTTPWSLPGNRAITYGVCACYGTYVIEEVQDGSLATVGEKIFLAQDKWEDFCREVGIIKGRLLFHIQGEALQGLVAAHPWAKEGYDFEVPLLPSEYVTTDAGTGLVHTAPGHGLEDFILGHRYHLEVANPISEKGIFHLSVPVVRGLPMDQSYGAIREALLRYNMLIGEREYRHQYPHSWRSKKPLFYRAIPQWFIALDGPLGLRKKALCAIESVTWYPENAKNRMRAMLESRPDWCISRQRVWGIPIATFLHQQTGAVLCDEIVFQRVEKKVGQEGSDFWFTDQAYEVLEGLYNPEEWIKNEDIIDVWFESGITHAVILQDGVPESAKQPLQWPASLYLEGSDQHRAWFQSSLVTAVALEGKAPYEAVLTHGFLLDEHGRKMSKSLGNVVNLQDIVDKKGAEILRLWVAYEDYRKDLKIGPSILSRVEDMYRRFRNTLRYALGGIHGLSIQEIQPVEEMGLLEQWVHYRLYQLDQSVKESLAQFDFQDVVRRLHLFCTQDLSSFYFDIIKDSLYCDSPSFLARQQIRTTLFHVFFYLVHWLAPFLCFTCEEAWSHFGRDIVGLLDPKEPLLLTEGMSWLEYLKDTLWSPTPFWSIHLNTMPEVPESWKREAVRDPMEKLRMIRSSVTGALEVAREQKIISHGLQANAIIYLTRPVHQSSLLTLLSWAGVAEVCGTSDVWIDGIESLPKDVFSLYPEIGVEIQKAKGEKCERCWKVLDLVNRLPLCFRCAEVCQET